MKLRLLLVVVVVVVDSVDGIVYDVFIFYMLLCLKRNFHYHRIFLIISMKIYKQRKIKKGFLKTFASTHLSHHSNDVVPVVIVCVSIVVAVVVDVDSINNVVFYIVYVVNFYG